MKTEIGLCPYAFMLSVPDLSKTAAYFRNALGFRLEWEAGGEWQCLARDSIRVMIGRSTGSGGTAGYVGCWQATDVDALHTEFVKRNAIVLQAPADKPWSVREMPIATPDGHQIVIAQPL